MERFCLHIAADLSEQAGSQVPNRIVSEGLETITSTHWCMFHNEVDPAHTLVVHIYVLASTHTSNRSFNHFCRIFCSLVRIYTDKPALHHIRKCGAHSGSPRINK